MPVSTRSSTYLPSPVSSVGSSNRSTAFPKIEPEPATSEPPDVVTRQHCTPFGTSRSQAGEATDPAECRGDLGSGVAAEAALRAGARRMSDHRDLCVRRVAGEPELHPREVVVLGRVARGCCFL